MWRLDDQKDNKLDARWLEGIWVGKSYVNDTHKMITDNGAVSSRSVKRLPESQRWNATLLSTVKGSPSNPKGEKKIQNLSETIFDNDPAKT